MSDENLIIAKSADKPGVSLFHNGDCYIYGDSRPEELDVFYTRISNYIKKLVLFKIPINFTFYFSYFNTVTQRYIYDLLFILSTQNIKGTITWQYTENDETIEEMGETYQNMFPELKIKMKEIKRENDKKNNCNLIK